MVLGSDDDEAMRVSSQWGLVLQAGGKYLSFWLGGLLEDHPGGLAGQHVGPLREGGMFSLSTRLRPLRVRAGAALLGVHDGGQPEVEGEHRGARGSSR